MSGHSFFLHVIGFLSFYNYGVMTSPYERIMLEDEILQDNVLTSLDKTVQAESPVGKTKRSELDFINKMKGQMNSVSDGLMSNANVLPSNPISSLSESNKESPTENSAEKIKRSAGIMEEMSGHMNPNLESGMIDLGDIEGMLHQGEKEEEDENGGKVKRDSGDNPFGGIMDKIQSMTGGGNTESSNGDGDGDKPSGDGDKTNPMSTFTGWMNGMKPV